MAGSSEGLYRFAPRLRVQGEFGGKPEKGGSLGGVLIVDLQLWTDADAREFIEKEYPWFLETFDGYPFNIQRADSIRYFVLYHFGGIYIDLDDVSFTAD